MKTTTRCLALTAIFFALTCSQAPAQSSGTIVVFQLTPEKFVLAADSRIVYRNIPIDSACKITVFRHQVAYANFGLTGYAPVPGEPGLSWEGVREAQAVLQLPQFRTAASKDRLQEIANAWGERVLVDLETLARFRPDVAREAARRGEGNLVGAVFAEANSKGQLEYADRVIRVHQGALAIARPVMDCENKLCAYGRGNVFLKFTEWPGPRTGDAVWSFSPSLLQRASIETLHAIRLVDLSVAYDGSGFVGGPADALEIWKDGTVHWIERKPNCPDSSE